MKVIKVDGDRQVKQVVNHNDELIVLFARITRERAVFQTFENSTVERDFKIYAGMTVARIKNNALEYAYASIEGPGYLSIGDGRLLIRNAHEVRDARTGELLYQEPDMPTSTREERCARRAKIKEAEKSFGNPIPKCVLLANDKVVLAVGTSIALASSVLGKPIPNKRGHLYLHRRGDGTDMLKLGTAINSIASDGDVVVATSSQTIYVVDLD